MKFKRILLIQPMHEKQKKKKKVRTSISFPWGLATLAGAYRQAGYDVEILDGQALQYSKEELLPEIKKFEFDIVGITAFSTQYPTVKLLAEQIKENFKSRLSSEDRLHRIKLRWFWRPPMWMSALLVRGRSPE